MTGKTIENSIKDELILTETAAEIYFGLKAANETFRLASLQFAQNYASNISQQRLYNHCVQHSGFPLKHLYCPNIMSSSTPMKRA